jgi:hypothetical protein
MLVVPGGTASQGNLAIGKVIPAIRGIGWQLRACPVGVYPSANERIEIDPISAPATIV